MRTSLDLPDDLFRELRILAAQRGTTLKELLRSAVEREIAEARSPRRTRHVKFPIFDSKQPGTLDLTNAEIEELLA